MGAGAWGTALAKVLSDQQHSVTLWTWQEEQAARLRDSHENVEFLPGVRLPSALRCTNDLEEALHQVEHVVLALPSHAMRDTLVAARPLLSPRVVVVSATKGIENDSLMLMSEVVADVLGPALGQRTVLLSGPSFAREVARALPTNIVAAARDASLAAAVQGLFATEWLRVYTNDDPTGVEVGGALKNVIAIAVGACDGLGFGHNTRAGLVTRGLAELTRLSLAKGGQARTLSGLAGLGDLVLTCTGELSRNRTVGYEMGQGRTVGEVLSRLGHVAEGVRTAKSAHDLGVRLGVELPITNEVYAVLYEGKDLSAAVQDLLTRPLRTEWG
jgi:glycerol-3-phosphate dehydrogenase (NAD(P)+)